VSRSKSQKRVLQSGHTGLVPRCVEIHAFSFYGAKTEPRRTLNSRADSEDLGQFNLRSLLAAAFSIVFKNERDLVAFIQRPDTRAL
jgi:hypothetical protein